MTAQSIPRGGTYPQNMGAVTGVSGIPFGGWSGMPASIPPLEDPFEYATRVALMQPADKRWRRFQNAMFLIEDFRGAYTEGSGSVCIRLQRGNTDFHHVFTLPFDCDDPLQWFAEHVLNMDFPNAKRAT